MQPAVLHIIVTMSDDDTAVTSVPVATTLRKLGKKSSGSELEPTMSVLVTHFRQRPLLYTIAMDAALVLVI